MQIVNGGEGIYEQDNSRNIIVHSNVPKMQARNKSG